MFTKISPTIDEMFPCGRTDRHDELVSDLLIFANALKMESE